MAKGAPLENAVCICIGKKTLCEAKAAGLTAVMSDQPSPDSVIDKLLEIYEKSGGPRG